MKKQTVGKTNVEISVLSMGAWAIGGGAAWSNTDDNESIHTIHAALDAGVTLIDTAPAYSFGYSEEIVGKALLGRRDKVILSSKCGLQWYEPAGSKHVGRINHSASGGTQMYRNLSPQSIRRDLEHSLKRLQTEYIDIYYTHWQSSDLFYIPIEETLGELLKMKQEGKIRAVGASNVCVNHLKEYLRYGGVDIIQEKYSLVDRRIEQELLPFCEQNSITLQTFSPIEQGLLAGKATMDFQIPKGDVREGNIWWAPDNRALVINMLAGWNSLTSKYNCSLSNLALYWLMSRSRNINVLFGARKASQVADNVHAASILVDKADLDRMTRDVDAVIANAKR